MTEQDLELTMPDGVADAVFFTPDPSAALPGVLHIPDIASVREAHRQMARRLAAEGYAVLLPNIFYRTGRPPLWSFQRRMGEPRTMERMAELTGPLTPEALHADVLAYIEFLRAQPGVRKDRLGVVGYCIGGSIAMRTAAAWPGTIAAAASFHGGGLYKANDPASPHLLLPKITAQLYFGHASGDASMPAEAIAHLEKALFDWDGEYESETYEGASHGWTVPDNPAFNPPQADRAFAKLTELFSETLQ